MTYQISHGRMIALATVGSVSPGDFLSMTASPSGLGVFILASATLFTMLKWIGAAHLAYLGLRLLARSSRLTVACATIPPLLAIRRLSPRNRRHRPEPEVYRLRSVVHHPQPPPSVLVRDSVRDRRRPGSPQRPRLPYALLAVHMRRRLATPLVTAGLTGLGGGALIAMGFRTAHTKRPTS